MNLHLNPYELLWLFAYLSRASVMKSEAKLYDGVLEEVKNVLLDELAPRKVDVDRLEHPDDSDEWKRMFEAYLSAQSGKIDDLEDDLKAINRKSVERAVEKQVVSLNDVNGDDDQDEYRSYPRRQPRMPKPGKGSSWKKR